MALGRESRWPGAPVRERPGFRENRLHSQALPGRLGRRSDIDGIEEAHTMNREYARLCTVLRCLCPTGIPERSAV